jgi:hypothetical protein
MSKGNSTVSQRRVIVAVDPLLTDNTTGSSGWVDARNATHIFGMVFVGVTDTTVDAKFQKATSSAGAGATDISGAAITQLSGTDDSKQASVEFSADLLGATYTHVRWLITCGDGTAGANISGFVMLDGRHMPVTQPSDYVEQVVL